MVATWDDMSDASKDLLFAALDYAIENTQTDEFGFTPFAMILHESGRRTLSRFVAGDDLAESLHAGRRALEVAPIGTLTVTLAWDGYLTRQGEKTEAVFVEAYEVEMDKGILVAQRYHRVEGRVRQLGNPLMQGETEPLIQVIGTTDSSE